MNRSLSVLVIAALTACTTTPPPSVSMLPGTTSIQGDVTDAAGEPLPGVTVTAKNARGTVYTQTTDAQGRYIFVHLAPGHYLVRAMLDGMVPVSREVELVAEHITVVAIQLHVQALAQITTVGRADTLVCSVINADRTQTRVSALHGGHPGGYLNAISSMSNTSIPCGLRLSLA